MSLKRRISFKPNYTLQKNPVLCCWYILQNLTTSEMKFFKPDVKISSTSPPEEILNSLAGSCGRWQITVTAFSMVAVFLGTLDRVAVLNSVPLHLNFTCADGNGSQCEEANGTTCEKFTFFKEYKTMITFTEKVMHWHCCTCLLTLYCSWIWFVNERYMQPG